MRAPIHRLNPDLSMRLRRKVTPAQRHRLASLAATAEMEVPDVYWASEASAAITRLEAIARQPVLEGFHG